MAEVTKEELNLLITCPLCQSPICEYKVEDFIERICWCCGHYESNSPAYRENPELFENMVRETPMHFVKKFLRLKSSDEILQHNKSDEDFTEPDFEIAFS